MLQGRGVVEGDMIVVIKRLLDRHMYTQGMKEHVQAEEIN